MSAIASLVNLNWWRLSFDNIMLNRYHLCVQLNWYEAACRMGLSETAPVKICWSVMCCYTFTVVEHSVWFMLSVFVNSVSCFVTSTWCRRKWPAWSTLSWKSVWQNGFLWYMLYMKWCSTNNFCVWWLTQWHYVKQMSRCLANSARGCMWLKSFYSTRSVLASHFAPS